MIARLPLLTLAVGLATGLVAAIVIANYSQQRREQYLRYLLIHAPESATTAASF